MCIKIKYETTNLDIGRKILIRIRRCDQYLNVLCFLLKLVVDKYKSQHIFTAERFDRICSRHCVRTLRVCACYLWAGRFNWDLIKDAEIWLQHLVLKISLDCVSIIPTPGAQWCWQFGEVHQAAPKSDEKIVNFAQLLTDGLRTTDWQKVFSCKPALSSL